MCVCVCVLCCVVLCCVVLCCVCVCVCARARVRERERESDRDREVCLSVCLSVCVHVCLFTGQCASIGAYMLVSLPVRLCTGLHVYISAYVSIGAGVCIS